MVGAWRSRRREVTIPLPRPSRISGRLGRSWGLPLCFAALQPRFPWYAGPGIPPRRYAARRLSPLVVLVAKQKQLEGFFYAVVQGGRESLIQGRCVPDGRFSHLYHGGDIRPLRAEYSEPSKGRGEEVASHLSAPRARQSQRAGPGANAFRRCLPERAGQPRLRRFSREGLRCRNRRSAP